MAQKIREPVAAHDRDWDISMLELNKKDSIVTVHFESSDGRRVMEQITGEEAGVALGVINTRDNRAKPLDQFVLEYALANWQHLFDGVIVEVEDDPSPDPEPEV